MPFTSRPGCGGGGGGRGGSGGGNSGGGGGGGGFGGGGGGGGIGTGGSVISGDIAAAACSPGDRPPSDGSGDGSPGGNDPYGDALFLILESLGLLNDPERSNELVRQIREECRRLKRQRAVEKGVYDRELIDRIRFNPNIGDLRETGAYVDNLHTGYAQDKLAGATAEDIAVGREARALRGSAPTVVDVINAVNEYAIGPALSIASAGQLAGAVAPVTTMRFNQAASAAVNTTRAAVGQTLNAVGGAVSKGVSTAVNAGAAVVRAGPKIPSVVGDTIRAIDASVTAPARAAQAARAQHMRAVAQLNESLKAWKPVNLRSEFIESRGEPAAGTRFSNDFAYTQPSPAVRGRNTLPSVAPPTRGLPEVSEVVVGRTRVHTRSSSGGGTRC